MLWILVLCFSQAVAPSTNDACDPLLYAGAYAPSDWQDTWTDVPANQWGYDFVNEVALPKTDPNSQTSTPCGYKSAQIYEDNNPGFCLTISDANERMVQVMIEAEEDSQIICLKTAAPPSNPMAAGALDPMCAEGKLRACFPAESDFYAQGQPFQIYVYSDPPTAEFSFFYKVDSSIKRDQVPANESATANVDMWCSMIAGTTQTLWPSNCIDMDFETPPPDTIETDLNSAYRFVPNVLFGLLFLAFY